MYKCCVAAIDWDCEARIRGHWSVRRCHPDNPAILTGGSGDVSPLPFHLLVNSFSSHIIHSIQILNVSTGPIFLPMVLNVHWNKVSQNVFQLPTWWPAKEIEVIIIQCYWWVTTAGVSCPGSDVCYVHFSVPNVRTRGWRAGELWSLAKPPNVSNWFPAPSSAQLQRGCNLIW